MHDKITTDPAKVMAKIPVTSYAQIRNSINNGDLIFFSGVKLGDWFIKKQAALIDKLDPQFSHVAIARWDYNRLKIIEAVPPLSRETYLSNFLKWWKGTVVFTNMNPPVAPRRMKQLRNRVVETAINNEGKQYEDIRKMAWSFIKHKFRSITGTSRLYCSEYASFVWSSNEVKLFPFQYEGEDNNLDPSELYQSKIIVPIGKLTAPLKG